MNVMVKTVIDSLRRNGFETFLVDTAEDARGLLLDVIPAGSTVGVGGSLTVRQIGILDALRERGEMVFDHWRNNLSPDELLETKEAQQRSDVFLSGTNAVTLQGELVNIDGFGNRVSALAFGPKKVIVVAGVNKITNNLTEGMNRSKEAAVRNAVRLNINTPCAKTGQCSDCSSPERICNITQIIHRRPREGRNFVNEFIILLINEEKGL